MPGMADGTPENVGPGSYIEKDKKDFTSMFRPKQGV